MSCRVARSYDYGRQGLGEEGYGAYGGSGGYYGGVESYDGNLFFVYIHSYIHSKCTVQNVIISLLLCSCICMLRICVI